MLGWCRDPAAPEQPVALSVRVQGQEVQRLATGTQDRPELFAAIDPRHGFLLDLPRGYVAGDLATGRLAIRPVRDGAALAPLPPRPRLVAQEQTKAGHAMLVRAEAGLGARGLAEMLAALGRPEGFGASQLAHAANAALAGGLAGARAARTAISPLDVPVGLRSPDGAVVVGREGHLFLLTGSNGELASLGADPGLRARLVRDWLAVIEARRSRAAAAGLSFVQMIVPEKANLARQLLPDPSEGGPSPFLAALEARIAEEPALSACTLLGRATMRSAARRWEVPVAALLRRIDSHPSPLGLHALACALLEHLGEAPPDLGQRFLRGMLAPGDLGEKFLPLPLFEEIAILAPRGFDRFGPAPSLVSETMPPDGGHIGRQEVWRNPAAPSAKRLLVFGNSVCGTGHAGQGLLSGWLARWFAEYHFHWQPAVDWAVVQAVRPDILVCQTVERFMGQVPQS